MHRVTIDRTRWLRGSGNGFLWKQEQNAGCCVGHWLSSLGITYEEMENLGTIDDLLTVTVQKDNTVEDLIDRVCYRIGSMGITLCDLLYILNDSEDHPGDVYPMSLEREARLFHVFALLDVYVEFIN